MRINVYEEELSGAAMITKRAANGTMYHGLRVWLKSPRTLRAALAKSAITFWAADHETLEAFVTNLRIVTRAEPEAKEAELPSERQTGRDILAKQVRELINNRSGFPGLAITEILALVGRECDAPPLPLNHPMGELQTAYRLRGALANAEIRLRALRETTNDRRLLDCAIEDVQVASDAFEALRRADGEK